MTIHIKKYNEGLTGDSAIENTAIENAVMDLFQEKEYKDKAKLKRDSALEVLTEFHFRTGAREFSLPGCGSVVAYQGTSKRFDKSAMALYLVQHGVDAGLVEEAMAYGTKDTVNDTVTVRFTVEK